jgi:hypothetical protein
LTACLIFSLRITRPITAEIIGAMIIPNLEAVTISEDSKARFVMKIDIVKPIPARQPAPVIHFQLRLSGSIPIPDLTAKYENRQIPAGLPKTRPVIIPKELEEVIFEIISEGIIIAVFARANRGSIKNAAGLSRNFSVKFEMFLSSSFLKGIANARSTPDIVAILAGLF